MSDQMAEDWDKTEDAKGNIEECEYFKGFLQSARKKNRSEEYCVDTGWSSKKGMLSLSIRFNNSLLHFF